MAEKIVSADDFEKEVQRKSLLKHYASVVKAVASGMGGLGFDIIISDEKEVGVDFKKKIITVPDPEDATYTQLTLARATIDHELALIRYEGRPVTETDPLKAFIQDSVENTRVDASACSEYIGCKANLQEFYYTANTKLLMDRGTPQEISDMQKLLLCIYADNINVPSYMMHTNMFHELYDRKYKNRLVKTHAECDELSKELYEDLSKVIKKSDMTKSDAESFKEELEKNSEKNKSLLDSLTKAIKNAESEEEKKKKSKGSSSTDYDYDYKPWSWEPDKKEVALPPEDHLEMVKAFIEKNKRKIDKMEIVKSKIKEDIPTYKYGDYKSSSYEPRAISSEKYKPATQYDQIITPTAHGDYPETTRLMRETKKHYGQLYAHMVRTYKQLLPAPKRMQPKGSIEGGKIYRAVVLDDTDIFIRKQRVEKFDVSFELLIDLSGSMRGSRISTAVESVILFSQVLNSLGIPFEVTGFTAQGSSRDSQHSYDKGYNRFCTLKHYIFKPFKERLSWQLFGRLENIFNGGIYLCENVDGEAVEWAAKRLVGQRSQKKMLIVFSDGQPYSGDSTSLLHTHLIDTVDKWSRRLSIIGVGINTSCVSTYYPKYAVVRKLEDLAGTVVGLIEDELKSEKKHG